MRSREEISIIIPAKNERENVEALIKSIHEQSYRPIEVVVVDGSSMDGTWETLRSPAEDLDGDNSKLKVLREQDFGRLRSPANARNIGINNSSGDNIVFLDADMILLDRDFLEKVKHGLDESPWVGVQAKPIIDSTLEKTLVAEIMSWHRRYVHECCGVRRCLLKERIFDPNLGFGEDRDFFDHHLKRKLKFKPLFLNTTVGKHEPHTWREFFGQQMWYGATLPAYARKHLSFRNSVHMALGPVMPSILPLLAMLTAVIACVNPSMLAFLLTAASAAVLIGRRIRFALSIPKEYRDARTLLLSTIVDCFARPAIWMLGLMKGLLSKK